MNRLVITRWLFFILPILLFARNSFAFGFTKGGYDHSVVKNPTFKHLSIQYGGNNNFVGQTYIDQKLVESIIEISQDVKNEEDELEFIKESLALMEEHTAKKLDIDGDKGGNFFDSGERFFNCIDEANNSTTYLKILQNSGLLKYFRTGPIKIRGLVVNAHNTATIISVNNPSEVYAVDSWYEDIGLPPYIVPFHIWKKGWRPS